MLQLLFYTKFFKVFQNFKLRINPKQFTKLSDSYYKTFKLSNLPGDFLSFPPNEQHQNSVQGRLFILYLNRAFADHCSLSTGLTPLMRVMKLLHYIVKHNIFLGPSPIKTQNCNLTKPIHTKLIAHATYFASLSLHVREFLLDSISEIV